MINSIEWSPLRLRSKLKMNSFVLQTVNLPFCFVVAMSLLSPSAARSQSSSTAHTGLSAFVAGGLLFGLGSVRVGYRTYEIGLLNSRTLGVDQVFAFSSFYASFGGGILLAREISPGFYAGVGYEPRLFWKVYLRAEASASAAISGQTSGELLLGVSTHFD